MIVHYVDMLRWFVEDCMKTSLRSVQIMFFFHQAHNLNKRFVFDKVKLSDLILESIPIFNHLFS